MQGHPLSFNEALRTLEIVGGRSVEKGFELQAVVFIPVARTTVQLSDITCGAAGLVQALAEQIGEEVVIAVPAPFVVEGDEEQVGAFEILEGCLPGSRRVAQNGITQWAAQLVEDRRAHQERLHALRLSLQDLLEQIVEHETVAAGERSDEGRGVRMSLQRQRGQLQTGNPPFRAGLQCCDVFCGEIETHCLIEERSGFGRSKPQVRDAQFA